MANKPRRVKLRKEDDHYLIVLGNQPLTSVFCNEFEKVMDYHLDNGTEVQCKINLEILGEVRPVKKEEPPPPLEGPMRDTAQWRLPQPQPDPVMVRNQIQRDRREERGREQGRQHANIEEQVQRRLNEYTRDLRQGGYTEEDVRRIVGMETDRIRHQVHESHRYQQRYHENFQTELIRRR